ncbi:hypothetical protein EJ08DRAFT_680736 [Tothia fuscella]|uniref:Uncharacterized protein n=1 Tax=Tothia fuscella TaxID=1048955 RepID=A0A9P4NMX8_9PEZI|nr:hypothetical protein EJ08DRAFT_680736 [Tothia fuscella]
MENDCKELVDKSIFSTRSRGRPDSLANLRAKVLAQSRKERIPGEYIPYIVMDSIRCVGPRGVTKKHHHTSIDIIGWAFGSYVPRAPRKSSRSIQREIPDLGHSIVAYLLDPVKDELGLVSLLVMKKRKPGKIKVVFTTPAGAELFEMAFVKASPLSNKQDTTNSVKNVPTSQSPNILSTASSCSSPSLHQSQTLAATIDGNSTHLINPTSATFLKTAAVERFKLPVLRIPASTPDDQILLEDLRSFVSGVKSFPGTPPRATSE